MAGSFHRNAGVLLLRGIEKRLGIVARLASCLRDKRDPDLILHTVEESARASDVRDRRGLRGRRRLQFSESI